MNKWLSSILFAAFTAFTASAASTVMPGSIDFNNPSLWGKEVMFGFDDNGRYTGTTRWYLDRDDASAYVRKYDGKSSGYLQSTYDTAVHRTITALKASEKAGPSASNGQAVSSGGVYIDTKATLYAYPKCTEPKIFNAEKDKINCWIYVPENGAVTNFIVTAGSESGPKNYITDAAVAPGVEFRLMIKAVPTDDGLAFEVYVNDRLVQATDGTTLFPSMLPADSEYAKKLYSLGVTGIATLDKINFTKTDPSEDPEYDRDNVSALRESAEITVAGYPTTTDGLQDFPALIRISEDLITGFHYSRCASGGSDIRFTDENGKLIPHEIDTWNTEGESLIWVKVPYFAKGTKITMHWALATGSSAPGNNPAEVWSDYIAVWHMSGAGSDHVAKDSSGHGFTAKMLEGGLLTAAEGSVIGTAGYTTGGKLWSADYEDQYPVKGNFTFTGWYMAKDVTTFGTAASGLFGKKEDGWRAKESIGWCGLALSSTMFDFYGDGGNAVRASPVPDVRKNWFHAGLVYSGDDYATMFFNGSRTDGKSMKITPNSTNFMVMAEGVWADEIRIAKKVRSADWIKTEYDQATASGYVTYGIANAKDRDNYWVVEPYVKPNSASVEDAAEIVVYAGQPRYGTPVLSYRDASGTILLEKPTAAGSYKAIVVVNEGVREGLYREMPFIIYEERAYHNISGYDRVMLFNSDESPESPVALQGYYDADANTNRVWEHTGAKWDGIGGFVLKGTKHVYYEAITGRKLWEFRHSRIGNLFQAREGLAPNMNFLPWGKGHACRFDDSEKLATYQSDAGTLIFQNRSTMFTPEDPAAAYSPVYTNGIGTVYFDAVNAYCGYRNRLKLQLTTETDEEKLTDPEIWKDVPVEVFAICGGRFEESMSTSCVTEITLAMTNTVGTIDWFYRIRAHIDTNVAARVRIVRTDDEWNGGDDDEGLVSIDNIIISNPAMGVDISQFGAPADPDNLVLRGQRAAFDIAFPTAADLGRFHAQVKVTYRVNNTTAIDTSFVGALSFKYRWRYLGQVVGDWTELLLEPDPSDPTRFVSEDPIVGLGEGDIEYNASAVVNAPFYDYWDYSGLVGWTWPDEYTERRGNVWISAEADGVYSKENLSPALGTDYFVRLREGRSDYEGFRLHVKRMNGPVSDKVGEQIVDMKLMSDNTWRGFYQTLTNGATNVYYYVEAYNRQSATGCDYQWNTNFFHGVNKGDIPANDVMEDGKAWARLPCDELTGYLMFQLEDTTRSLSIIHADYQNFNSWTDARLDTGEFLGTSTALPTSGVSRTTRSYASDFSLFRDSVSSNTLWIEQFNISGAHPIGDPDCTWKIDEPFSEKSSPNGWYVENGMWVCESFRVLGGFSMALLMESDYGVITMNRQRQLRGIEVLKYDARIAQTYGNSRVFNYYVGTTNDVYNMGAYTFVVPCSMETPDDMGGEVTSFTGVGTLSAVTNYRDSKCGYEVRVERVSQKTVTMSLYKWYEDGSCVCLGTSPKEYSYSGNGGCGLDAYRGKFGALFISCTNTTKSVRITAGLMSTGQLVDDALMLSGKSYFKVSYEDTDEIRFTSGTCGVGSKDCPATFAHPKLSPNAVAWSTSGASRTGSFRYWKTAAAVTFKDEHSLLATADDYDAWNIYNERLPKKSFAGQIPLNVYGFRAAVTPQQMVIYGSTDGNAWSVLATNVVSSFGLNTIETPLYLPENYYIRIRTLKDSGGPDVVVDNFDFRQWRGEDYDNADAGIGIPSGQLTYGAPTNFIFTTAWNLKDDQGNEIVELSPMRSLPTAPAGVRSPLMDGLSGRGLGLGAFSFSYRNADRRARLLVQICTNSIDQTRLATRTKELDSWTTVKTVDFSEMTEDDLASGLVTAYIGLHGVKGAMRVIIDPERVEAARDPTLNPDGDPTFGRVYITAAGAKDNPKLDSGSWWGWNLRTTDDETKLYLPDGDPDIRLHGLAYALNDSIENDTREGDVYETHKPFLQTPILTRGAIGEVTFKARKYSAGDHAPSVAIYGMKAYDPAAKDGEFEFLTNIVVNCERFETFVYQAPVSDNYTSFRLAVTGVDGITGDGSDYPPDDPPEGPQPDSGRVARVLIDEVAVFEAIKARLGFCHVGVFRNNMAGTDAIEGLPCRSEQPLCKESWGIQTELYAVRLSERIDYQREPKVIVHWYKGTSPWGYENWRDRPEAGSAVLARATGTSNLVYRSSYLTAPDAVLPMAMDPNTIYQYSLEVEYYMEGQKVPLTNVLDAADWTRPEWYDPIDYNESLGKGNAFSAFNIIDEIAPGWAWINEINIFGARENYNNSDIANQYIEIAAPVEATLKGWYIRLLVPETGSDAIITNKLATFGISGLSATKQIGTASNMVFHVVGSPKTAAAGKLKKSDGTLDGKWTCQVPSTTFGTDGVIGYYQGMGFQLVRPSGIVEHELVAIGTNLFASSVNRSSYDPTNVVNYLNSHMTRTDFFYAGSDDGGKGNSLGVFDSQGESKDHWNNFMIETPGRINQFQQIPNDHPTPYGSSIMVYANLLGAHIVQTVGDAVRTNLNQVLVVKKGSNTGTNITYQIDEWYELAGVSVTEGGPVWTYEPSKRMVTVTVAKGCSNNTLTVEASAQIDKRLRDLGCTDQNRYTPAIIDWLVKKQSLKDVYGTGTDWPDSDGNIYLADFMGMNRQVITNMTLTQMYWLDICPTISNQCLVGGMVKPPLPDVTKPAPGYEGQAWNTNIDMSVFMMITNTVEGTESPYYGKAWAPYVLRGLEPGVTSWDYVKPESTWGWTNESFKITGILANGLTSEHNEENWIPLRYFVFTEESFDENFTSRVQVAEPHSPRSLGYMSGWGEWFRKYPEDESPIFFSWAIDERKVPVNVEPLKADSSFNK